MEDLRRVPVLRVLIPFCAGIVVAASDGACCDLPGGIFPLVPALCAVLPTLFIRHRRGGWWPIVNAILIFVTVMLAGIASYDLTMRQGLAWEGDEYHVFSGRVRAGQRVDTNKVVLEVKTDFLIGDSVLEPFKQNLKVYVRGEVRDELLTPGTGVILAGKVFEIRNRGNPGEFDYEGYMQRRGFRYSLFLSDSGMIRMVPRKVPMEYLPQRIRHRIIQSWNADIQSFAVLRAITLGDKSMLETETRQSFSDAGAMHVLAVSGLHVGMIWLILDRLIRLPRHPLRWRFLKVILIASILWMYAGITGFSDSVTRSVTMFSLLSIARMLGRESPVFNTLLLSAFILLLLKPCRLEEPGFQLSYAAVAGIVAIQPVISRSYDHLHRWIRWVLDLLSVSVSAQLATLPFVLLYFGQFPTWFLLTNLMVIPLVSLLLSMFVVLSPVMIAFPGMEFPGMLLSWLAGLLQRVVELVADIPGATVSPIHISPVETLLTGSAILFLVLLIVYRKSIMLMALLASTSLLISIPVWLKRKEPISGGPTLYHFQSATCISGFDNGFRQTYIFMDCPDQGNDELPTQSAGQLQAWESDYLEYLGSNPGTVHRHQVDIYTGSESYDLKSFNACHRVDDSMSDSSHADSPPDQGLHGPVTKSVKQHKSQFFMPLSRGIWAGHITGKSCLVMGNANWDEARLIIDSLPWNLVVFRNRFPRDRKLFANLAEQSQVIGDGTLKWWEREWLEEMIPQCYLVSDHGAYIWDQQRIAGDSLFISAQAQAKKRR